MSTILIEDQKINEIHYIKVRPLANKLLHQNLEIIKFWIDQQQRHKKFGITLDNHNKHKINTYRFLLARIPFRAVGAGAVAICTQPK